MTSSTIFHITKGTTNRVTAPVTHPIVPSITAACGFELLGIAGFFPGVYMPHIEVGNLYIFGGCFFYYYSK